eukprot:TRINITY_DN6840_c0_g1_i4.p1 TRINITY_DN6840_c0_g1~~TRINITY_DN6840_c0_g1_i4.p1  ORF type:complete len:1771 (+),score=542.77 TRINITY_DN6840_c0_g1_i4:615-5315(+)
MTDPDGVSEMSGGETDLEDDDASDVVFEPDDPADNRMTEAQAKEKFARDPKRLSYSIPSFVSLSPAEHSSESLPRTPSATSTSLSSPSSSSSSSTSTTHTTSPPAGEMASPAATSLSDAEYTAQKYKKKYKSSRREASDLKGTLQKQEADLTRTKREATEATDSRDKLRDQERHLQACMVAANTLAQERLDQITSLNSTIGDLQSNMEAQTRELKEAKAKEEAIKEDIARSTKESEGRVVELGLLVTSRTKELEALRQQLADMQGRDEAQKAEANKDTDAINARLAVEVKKGQDTMNELHASQREAQAATQRAAHLEKEHRAAREQWEAEKQALEESSRTLQANLAGAVTERDQANEQATRLQTNLGERAGELDKMRQEVDSLVAREDKAKFILEELAQKHQADMDAAREQVKALEAQVATLREEREKAQATHATLSRDADATSSVLKEATALVAVRDQEIMTLRSQLEASSRERSDLEGNVQALTASHALLQEARDRLQTDLTAMATAHGERAREVAEKETRIRVLDEEVAACKQQLEAVKGDAGRTQDQTTAELMRVRDEARTSGVEISRLRHELEAGQAREADITAQLHQKETHLNDAWATQKETAARNDELQTTVTQLAQQLSSHERERQTAVQTMQDSQLVSEQHVRDIEALTKTKEEDQATISTLQAKVQEMGSTEAKMRQEMETAQHAEGLLALETTRLHGEVQERDQTIRALRDELGASQGQQESLRGDSEKVLQNARTEVEQMRSAAQQQQEEIEGLRRQLQIAEQTTKDTQENATKRIEDKDQTLQSTKAEYEATIASLRETLARGEASLQGETAQAQAEATKKADLEKTLEKAKKEIEDLTHLKEDVARLEREAIQAGAELTAAKSSASDMSAQLASQRQEHSQSMASQKQEMDAMLEEKSLEMWRVVDEKDKEYVSIITEVRAKTESQIAEMMAALATLKDTVADKDKQIQLLQANPPDRRRDSDDEDDDDDEGEELALAKRALSEAETRERLSTRKVEELTAELHTLRGSAAALKEAAHTNEAKAGVAEIDRKRLEQEIALKDQEIEALSSRDTHNTIQHEAEVERHQDRIRILEAQLKEATKTKGIAATEDETAGKLQTAEISVMELMVSELRGQVSELQFSSDANALRAASSDRKMESLEMERKVDKMVHEVVWGVEMGYDDGKGRTALAIYDLVTSPLASLTASSSSSSAVEPPMSPLALSAPSQDPSHPTTLVTPPTASASSTPTLHNKLINALRVASRYYTTDFRGLCYLLSNIALLVHLLIKEGWSPTGQDPIMDGVEVAENTDQAAESKTKRRGSSYAKFALKQREASMVSMDGGRQESEHSRFVQDLRMVVFDVYVSMVHLSAKAVKGICLSTLLSMHTGVVGFGSESRLSADTGSAALIKYLGQTWEVLTSCHVGDQISHQFFKQLFYIVDVTICNELFENEARCNPSTGVHLKLGISKLKEWVATNDTLAHAWPLGEHLLTKSSEAASVLMMDKRVFMDLDSILAIFRSLSPAQIARILDSFQPDEVDEDPVPEPVKHEILLNWGLAQKEDLLFPTKTLLPRS